MSDITQSEFTDAIDAVADPAFADLWANVPTIPASLGMCEFLIKCLHTANKAAQAKNATLAVGSKIASYPSPATTAPIVTSSGAISYRVTYSVAGIASTDLNAINIITS